MSASEQQKILDEAIQSPQSFSVEGLSQSNRNAGDLIALMEYQRKTARPARRRHPLCGLVSHIIPPGVCYR